VILEVPFEQVDSIYFTSGGGNVTDTFHNNTDLPSEAWGGGGADNFYGGGSSDSFHGGDGEDNLFGYGGVDFLRGNGGNDDLYGGDGGDYLYGGEDYDDLFGGDGVDHLYGQDGPDTLDGGHDNDVDFLQAGDDSDFFTPEVHTFSVNGQGYMVNYDTFDDCMYGDQVTGYDGMVAEAFCNGDAVQLNLIYLGPADKTIEQPDPWDEVQQLDPSALQLSLITDDGTYVIYEATIIDAAPMSSLSKRSVEENQSIEEKSTADSKESRDVDYVYAKSATDWNLLDIDPLIDELVSGLVLRSA
jgi:hypothetical protein